MEPIELAWDEEAWDAYQTTASQNPPLRQALTIVLARLGTRPVDAALRVRRMQRPPLFVVPVRGGGEDWVIMWDQADDGVPQIWYVGPSPF